MPTAPRHSVSAAHRPLGFGPAQPRSTGRASWTAWSRVPPHYGPSWALDLGPGALVRGDQPDANRAEGEAPGWRVEMRTRSTAGRIAKRSGESRVAGSPSIPA